MSLIPLAPFFLLCCSVRCLSGNCRGVRSPKEREQHVLLGAKDAFEKRYLVIGTITDLSKARVVHPQSKNAARQKLAYPVKEDSHRRAMVREKSARYRKKK